MIEANGGKLIERFHKPAAYGGAESLVSAFSFRPMDARYRAATSLDAGVLAPMNAQLIRDEGHRNSMTMPQLTERMSEWLKTEYQAFVFEIEGKAIGYALYRVEPEYIYLRQLFVQPEMRRRGVARRALEWLCHNAWDVRARVRIDVLVGNHSAIEFWRSVGFTDYCLTMERPIQCAR